MRKERNSITDGRLQKVSRFRRFRRFRRFQCFAGFKVSRFQGFEVSYCFQHSSTLKTLNLETLKLVFAYFAASVANLLSETSSGRPPSGDWISPVSEVRNGTMRP